MKIDKQKQLVIEQLAKTPIIQVVAEKVGIHRSTIYRWKASDPEFSEAIEEAIDKSVSLVNDLAESQLISAIRDKNITAIIYWLKHHHKAYETRVRVTGSLKHSVDKLDDAQNDLVMKALTKAGLLINEGDDDDNATI